MRSFSSLIRLKPPWLPGTIATSAFGIWPALSRACVGVMRALRAPVIWRTGTGVG
jgi:hypothetical protein